MNKIVIRDPRPVMTFVIERRIRVRLALVRGDGADAAQPPGRVATTTAALRASPVFFHGKQIAVLGSVVESRDLYRLEAAGAPRRPTSRPTSPASRSTSTGASGRRDPRARFAASSGISAASPKATRGSRRSTSGRSSSSSTRDDGRPRDQVFVITERQPRRGDAAPGPDAARDCAGARAATRIAAPASRAVSAAGTCSATSPTPLPTPGKWDFVLQSADAAVWVSGLRPRGRGFELDPVGSRRHRPLGPGRRHGPARRQPRLDRRRARSSSRRHRGEAVVEVEVPVDAGRSRRRRSSSARPCPTRPMSRPRPSCACSSRATWMPGRSRIACASAIRRRRRPRAPPAAAAAVRVQLQRRHARHRAQVHEAARALSDREGRTAGGDHGRWRRSAAAVEPHLHDRTMMGRPAPVPA